MKLNAETQQEWNKESEHCAPSPVRVAFGFGSADRHVSEQYLCEAFDPAQTVLFDFSALRPNASIGELLASAEARGERPSHWLHYIGAPGLPAGLSSAPIPTACLNIDTFGWLDARLRWAMLFDTVFVFQPRFVAVFQQAGHPRVFLLPHAADARFFDSVERERDYELGWVGHLMKSPLYMRRRRVLLPLLEQFHVNDWRSHHSKAEAAEVYQRAKIVVNVSRDEFPEEANMRCYEAMAGGALLLTGMPTELTELGFREGEHFAGWHDEREVPERVRYYLAHEEERRAIARAGRELVLREHTYHRRRETLLSSLRAQGGEFTAPGRKWPEEEVRRVYMEYYHWNALLPAVLHEFNLLRKKSTRAALKSLPLVLRALRRGLMRSMK